jgi:hypothetical protein
MALTLRTGMDDLITVVRGLIHDPATGGLFSDLDIQQALDRYRSDEFYVQLASPWETAIDENGQPNTTWKHFYAPHQSWDKDWTLYGPSRLPLDPEAENVVADELNGLWTFPDGHTKFYVLLTGRNYDIYGAAVLLLKRAVAGLVDDFDVRTPEGTSMTRSQKSAQRLALINEYRLSMRSRITVQTRSNERWR